MDVFENHAVLVDLRGDGLLEADLSACGSYAQEFTGVRACQSWHGGQRRRRGYRFALQVISESVARVQTSGLREAVVHGAGPGGVRR